MPRNTYGPTVKERVKRLLEALLAFVDWEFEDSFDIKSKWEAEDSTNPKLIVETTLVTLEWLIAKDKYPGKLTKPKIREALNLLKDFLKILEDNRTQTKGVDTWHFTLTLWSKDREKNLKQFDKAWEDSRPEKSKALEAKFKKSDAFDWRNISLAMLEAQKPLTTNALMRDEDDRFELEEIHVPLALVERKKPNLIRGDTQAQQGSRLYEPEYEEKQRFEHEQFLLDILTEGKGKHNGKRIAIIGEPGAGKTTLLRKIAFWVQENTEILPISISLADLPETNSQQQFLEQYLLDKWLPAALPYISLEMVEVTEALKTELKKLCNQGRVWLLLDGVDEMPVQGEERLWAISNQLKGWVGQARVVLTCRVNVWEANRNVLADNFEIYRTLDFSYGDSTTPDRVEEFIAKWFNKTPNLGQQLRQELEEPGKERIKDLVKNPLRLALLCSTWNLWRDRGGLPDTKAKLYQGFVEKFYDWKGREFSTNSSQREQLNRALGELAKLAIDQTESRFRLKHSLVCQVLGKPDEGLFELALQLGWLNKVGLAAESPDETVYALWHPTFEEYFAALAVDDWDDFLPRNHVDSPVYGKRYRIFEPQWKEVILLWLGREEKDREEKEEKEEKEAFIKRIINFNDGFNGKFYWYRAYFIAAAVIAEFRSHFADEIAQQIITWSFDCFYKEVGYFSKNLQDAQFHSSIIEGARAALPEPYYHKAVEFILPLLDRSKARHMRHEAIETLGVIGTGNCDAIEALNSIIDDGYENICCVEIASCSLVKITTENLQAKALQKIINWINSDSTKIAISISKLFMGTFKIDLESLDFIIEVFAKHLEKIDPFYSHNNWFSAKAFLNIAPIDHPQYQYATDIKNISEARIKQLEDSVIDALLNDINILGLGDITAQELESQILKVIYHLNFILRTNQDKEFQKIAGDCLTSILLGQQVSNQAIFLHLVIQGLKDCPDDRIRENYSVIWHCAQNLPYPTFYEAWHDSATTRDPEVPETTGDSTPYAQSFNLANLPQVLANAIDNEPGLSNKLKLICIDISKFIDPDNPAQEIYDEMVTQNCPEWQNGYPDTMQKLKIYWNSLRRPSEIPLFFICYDSTALSATPTGFSDSFLKALSKFDRAICVVCEQENIPLPTFSPSQPNLVAAVVAWIRRSILENRHPI
ncbi:NACHT C-terminal alpha/beta 1 domain-containing protein [Microcoleus sp. S13_C5]|uniref:NACHT C-terminal alpha/beta 1 domain-containing protein n=1 Tax=Microcoleus sp. S13_C5 TaxID=3055411 RepID=UPI002FD66919